jgi:RNA polymerase sigma factor FliA
MSNAGAAALDYSATARRMPEDVGLSSEIARYDALVQRTAARLMSRLPASVDVDDLIQAGRIGLLEALRGFVSGHGAKFETYASYRIRGAMIDTLRDVDWAPRSLRRQQRLAGSAKFEIERRESRGAKPAEIAARIGIALEQYFSITHDAARSVPVVLDTEIESNTLDERTDLFQELAGRELHDAVRAALQSLPRVERRLLALLYGAGMNALQAAPSLQLSGTQVRQLHARALARLRTQLASWA